MSSYTSYHKDYYKSHKKELAKKASKYHKEVYYPRNREKILEKRHNERVKATSKQVV